MRVQIWEHVCTLAVGQLVGGACKVVGLAPGGDAVEGVANFLARHFIDHSARLEHALRWSNDRAWKSMEVALAGDSLWDRCKRMLVSADERAFREQVKPFLDACPLAELQGRTAYRQACLEELRASRKAGLLTEGNLEPRNLARQAGAFARFHDPDALVNAQFQMLSAVGEELRQAGHSNLAEVVSLRPQRGEALLLVAVRFFFRRAVEEDKALFQGLAFAKLEELQSGQEAGFRSLQQALNEQADRLEKVLVGIEETVVATHGAVLDLHTEQQRLGEQNQDIYQAVLDLQSKMDMLNREVQPGDSLSIRNDTERALVKQLVGRYRDLPDDQRQQLPALLNAIGKLEVAMGNFEAAQEDFTAVAGLVGDPQAQAEAHANAYHAALERRDWDTALAELREAARLDPARHTLFPMDKYQPQRILGAGGFGVAFLCRHRFLNADVVVKTLQDDDLDRGIDQIFGEAQTLRQLDHPAIIRVQDGGFGDAQNDSHPYLVMDYFPGKTLEDQAREKPLEVDDLVAVARQMASGLQAAHSKGILHRDVKPANLLVRKEGRDWEVKLIDFGLALRRTGKETMLASSSTIAGSSIAGTLDYAAPEQMGKLPGVSAGPTSDIYGFARTCCYALFQTPQPLPRHWRRIPEPLADLLEMCLEETPEERPADFGIVLERLASLGGAPDPSMVTLPLAPVGASIPVSEMTEQQRRQELAALAQRVSGCTRCELLARSRKQTVFGVGPLDPLVCFMGEAPGADEDRQGEPFVGAAGQLFNRLLREVGLRREEVYICNILKCRPPGNRTPQAPEVNNCREYLERQLDLVRPQAICTLGGCASQSLLGTTESIGRLRGRLHDYRGTLVLCTYHPAFLLPNRSPQRKPDVVNDIKMLLRRLGRS